MLKQVLALLALTASVESSAAQTGDGGNRRAEGSPNEILHATCRLRTSLSFPGGFVTNITAIGAIDEPDLERPPRLCLTCNLRPTGADGNVTNRRRFKYWGTQTDIELEFHPTTFCASASDTLLIAGQAAGQGAGLRAETVLYELRFNSPRERPDQYGVAAATIKSRRLVARFDEPGKRLIKALRRHRGRTRTALVQFNDSSDVWMIDLATGSLVEQVTSAGLVPANYEAHLLPDSTSWRLGWSGDHITLGYFQFLRGDSILNAKRRVDRDAVYGVAFLDFDRDGTIDHLIELTATTANDLGFNDASNIRRRREPR